MQNHFYSATVDTKGSLSAAFTQVSWEGAWENETRETHAAVSGGVEGEADEKCRYPITFGGENEGSSRETTNTISCSKWAC